MVGRDRPVAVLTRPHTVRVVRRPRRSRFHMRITFFVLFCVGLAMLVRSLMTVSTSRAAWEARSIPGTAHVVSCTPYRDPEIGEAFTMLARYVDTRGQPHTMELSAGQQFPIGHPIDIRFDPQRPATAHLPEQFAGSNLPIALVGFGGGLMLVSFAYVINHRPASH